MKAYDEKFLENLMNSDLSLDAQVNVLDEIMKNVLDEGPIRARSIRFKLQKHMTSEDPLERLYAINNIVSE